MPERAPPLPELAGLSLVEIAQAAAERRLPPVEQWHPPHCGDSGMRIARDGTWFHDGRPITRPAMVRLFASLLRRETDGRHVLVTPVEKLDIAVDDAPFAAIEVTSEGEGPGRTLAFRLNTDEPVIAGPNHGLQLIDARPYLHVRAGLHASLARPVYYELAELALREGGNPAGLWSGGSFFALSDE
ncbi:MAG TPA: DUF1285 domain-containing protein [Sphingomonas sp.]|nr:DUF1285 domain-containing protein [Sphingomonas sp.]